MDNDDPIEVRMGTFFVVIGGGVFLLFVLSDVADKVDFDYFFISLILFAVGYYFRRTKAPPPPSGRFAWFKGFWGKMRAGKSGGGGGGEGKEKKDKK
jgi:hypothetical protein